MNAPPSHHPSRRPILVTGAHRSGTTFAGRILAESPLLRYIDEPFNVNHGTCACGAAFTYWFQYVTESSGPLLQRHLQHIIADCDSPLSTRALVKDPIAVFSAEWLARTFTMDVIVLIRHPAAFAASLKRLNWKFSFAQLLGQNMLMRDHLQPFAREIRDHAAHTKDIIEQAALLWRIIYSVVDGYRSRHPDWHFVRHEDLSRNPVSVFRNLCRGLSVAFTNGMRSRILEYTGSGNPSAAPQGEPHVLKLNSASAVWNWKKQLSSSEIRSIRDACYDVSALFYSDEDW